MSLKTRTWAGGLIGGIVFAAFLLHAAGIASIAKYAPEPAPKTAKRYYPSGKLYSEKFYGPGGQTLIKEYYESGPLKAETPYVNGRMEGVVKEYYKNGRLRSEISYKDGKRDGPFKAYYENGELKGEMAYKGGEIQGVLRYDQNEPLSREIVQELAKQIDDSGEKEK